MYIYIIYRAILCDELDSLYGNHKQRISNNFQWTNHSRSWFIISYSQLCVQGCVFTRSAIRYSDICGSKTPHIPSRWLTAACKKIIFCSVIYFLLGTRLTYSVEWLGEFSLCLEVIGPDRWLCFWAYKGEPYHFATCLCASASPTTHRRPPCVPFFSDVHVPIKC